MGASAEHLVRDIRKGKLDDLGRIGELARRAVDLKALPIVGTRDLACELAVGLAELGAEPVDGFAHLGCGCAGHLFRFSGNPLTSGAFVALLMSYRHARHAIALADG